MSTYKLTGVLKHADSKSITLGCSDEAMIKLDSLKKRILPNKTAGEYRNPIDEKSVRITHRISNEEYFQPFVGERVTLWCKVRKYNFIASINAGSRIMGWVLNFKDIKKSY